MNQGEPNDVGIDVIKNELGVEGWKKVEALTVFLFAPELPIRLSQSSSWLPKIPRKGRFAPSVVSRMEVGVFGTSMPRFCYRIYFEGVEGFVNVRRLKTLQKQLYEHPEAWWAERNPDLKAGEMHPRIRGELPRMGPPQLLPDGVGNCVVGDCLLPLPQRYQSQNFHVIETRLIKEHGEILHWQEDNTVHARFGVPYVRTVAFGGGLCAQASCFIATALLCEEAQGVYGLSEITALASDPKLKELVIGGLDENEIVNYFRCVGLAGIHQFCNPHVVERKERRNQDTDFKQCLHGYVASDMPVILFVDIARLNGTEIDGDSIYDSNTIGLQQAPLHRRHAVTVVGGSRWEESSTRRFESPEAQNCSFLFLDSTAMPFVKATVQQLAQVGMWDGDNVPNEMRHPALISVTPERVKMPLLCFGNIENENGWNYGLIEISRRFPFANINPEAREFILRPLNKLSVIRAIRHFQQDNWEMVADMLCHTLPSALEEHLKWQNDRWVWLECGENIIKIWDAEIAPDKQTDPKDILRAIIKLEDLHVVARIFSPLGGKNISATESASLSIAPSKTVCPGIPKESHLVPDNSSATLGASTLKASVISSFSAIGARHAAKFWSAAAPTTPYTEVYVCMQPDLKDLLRHSGHDRAVAVLAKQARRERNLGNFSRMIRRLTPKFWTMFTKNVEPETFAKKLQDVFKANEIVAFATFMPELMAPHPIAFEQAQDALIYLVETARYFKTPERPFTIELVGGSVLQGIWKAATADGDLYAVNRLDSESALNILLKRLEPIAAVANEVGDVQLALEIEPGPLFTLDPFGGVRPRSGAPVLLHRLCSLIENEKYFDSNLKHVVGINLDVPHWAFLSKISPSWLDIQENKIVRDRIIHAHISDHDNGHFCDNAVGVCHNKQEFKEWIELLAKLSLEKRLPEYPRYSGFVSCEMEACKSSSHVSASLRNVQELL